MSLEALANGNHNSETESNGRTEAFKSAVERSFTKIKEQTGVNVLSIRGEGSISFGYTDMTRSECYFESEIPDDATTGPYIRRYETKNDTTTKVQFVIDNSGDVIHIGAPIHDFNFGPLSGNGDSSGLMEFFEVLDRIEEASGNYILGRKSRIA